MCRGWWVAFFFFFFLDRFFLATNKIRENLNRCQNKFPLKFPIQAWFVYSLIWTAPGLLRRIFSFKGKKPKTNIDNIYISGKAAIFKESVCILFQRSRKEGMKTWYLSNANQANTWKKGKYNWTTLSLINAKKLEFVSGDLWMACIPATIECVIGKPGSGC